MASIANQVRFDRVVDKVKRIIELAFEVGFTFTPIESLESSGLIEKYNTLEGLQEPVDQTAKIQPLNPIYINEDVFLPLAIKNSFVGVGQLIGAKKLSASEVKKAGQIIDGLVCGSLTLIDRIQTLEQKEQHLKTQIDPKIISITKNQYKKHGRSTGTPPASPNNSDASRSSMSDSLNESAPPQGSRNRAFNFKADVIRQDFIRGQKEEPVQPTGKKQEKTSGTNFPTFITAKTDDLLHKIALELHTKSSKMVLVDVNVLRMPLNVESIKHFGSVTLFIKDLEKLSDQRKEVFTAYLRARDFRSTDGPNIIAGSRHSGPELVKRGVITPELYQLLGQVVVQHSDEDVSQEQLDLYVNMVAKAKREFLWFSVIQSLGFTPYMSTH